MNTKIRLVLVFFFFLAATIPLSAVELTVVGPPETVLKIPDGSEVVLDSTGKYVFRDLEPGDTVRFTAEAEGRYPANYTIEIGSLSKTFRIDPPPTGVFSGELKFTDAGFCPALGVELYFIPENAYLSIDLYQSFISLTRLFTGSYEVSSRYIMPMLGAGLYVLPADWFVRLNFGFSIGAAFGDNLPNVLFAAEVTAGLEFKFFDHYILFAEFNPRLHSSLSSGWEAYSDIYGVNRAAFMNDIGGWSLYALPATMFGMKFKY